MGENHVLNGFCGDPVEELVDTSVNSGEGIVAALDTKRCDSDDGVSAELKSRTLEMNNSWARCRL